MPVTLANPTDPRPINLLEGDCLAVLGEVEADRFDAIVTDPPYHLGAIVRRFGADTATVAQEGIRKRLPALDPERISEAAPADADAPGDQPSLFGGGDT